MPVQVHLASASGNAFAYAWEDEAGNAFDGARWARALCARGEGLALDGLFLLSRPREGQPWRLEHWDPDGGATFCGNGSRAALAVPGAPPGAAVEAVSNGLAIALKRGETGAGLRMPEGPGFGLQEAPLACPLPHAFAWIGNPQLLIEHPDVAGMDLAAFAPPYRHHAALPEGANVNALEVTGPGQARIRSWERGVEGETLCCGTGCAAAGAWLAQRTGRRRWQFQPAGHDPVTVEVEAVDSGVWRSLWLSGPVRCAGRLTVDFLP